MPVRKHFKRIGNGLTTNQKIQQTFYRITRAFLYLAAYYGMPFHPAIKATVIGSVCIAHGLSDYIDQAKEHMKTVIDIPLVAIVIIASSRSLGASACAFSALGIWGWMSRV